MEEWLDGKTRMVCVRCGCCCTSTSTATATHSNIKRNILYIMRTQIYTGALDFAVMILKWISEKVFSFLHHCSGSFCRCCFSIQLFIYTREKILISIRSNPKIPPIQCNAHSRIAEFIASFSLSLSAFLLTIKCWRWWHQVTKQHADEGRKEHGRKTVPAFGGKSMRDFFH